jgi:hypothetical protein
MDPENPQTQSPIDKLRRVSAIAELLPTGYGERIIPR